MTATNNSAGVFVKGVTLTLIFMLFLSNQCIAQNRIPQPMTDTGQAKCYSADREIACPVPGVPFFGQDAQYVNNPMSYKDNGDGTFAGLVTGLRPPAARF